MWVGVISRCCDYLRERYLVKISKLGPFSTRKKDKNKKETNKTKQKPQNKQTNKKPNQPNKQKKQPKD